MRLETYTLNDPGPSATGNPQACADLWDKWVQVESVGAANITLEGSISGVGYAPLGAAITTNGFTQVTQAVRFIRVTRAAGAGTPTITLGGRMTRET